MSQSQSEQHTIYRSLSRNRGWNKWGLGRGGRPKSAGGLGQHRDRRGSSVQGLQGPGSRAMADDGAA
eukprot:4977259-Prymnesium_polylepis.1